MHFHGASSIINNNLRFSLGAFSLKNVFIKLFFLFKCQSIFRKCQRLTNETQNCMTIQFENSKFKSKLWMTFFLKMFSFINYTL